MMGGNMIHEIGRSFKSGPWVWFPAPWSFGIGFKKEIQDFLDLGNQCRKRFGSLSGWIHEAEDSFEFLGEFLISFEHLLDLFAGMQDGGVVAAAKSFADLAK